MNVGVKIRIISFLFAVASLLVAAIVFFAYLKKDAENTPAKKSKYSATEISASKIRQKFELAFDTWGINPEWRKKFKVDKTKNEVDEIYRVELPRDVTVDFILLELNNIFAAYKNIEINGADLNKRRKTEIKINYNGVPVIIAYVKKNFKEIRTKRYVAIVLDAREMGEERMKALKRDFVKTYLFRIGSDEKTLAEKAKKDKLDAAFVIDDNIDEYKYSLDASLTKGELKASISRILRDFGKDKIFFYDERSELCRQPHFEFVKKIFSKHAVLLPMKTATNFEEKTVDEIKAAFLLKIKSDEPKIFLINAEKEEQLSDFLVLQWKKGVRFLTLGNYVDKAL